MVPVAVVLAAILASCLASAYVTHRMLREHREVLAALLTRRALEVKDHVTSAAEAARIETRQRLDGLAEATGSLADATRALLMTRDQDGRRTRM